MYNLQHINSYVKSVIAATMGEIVYQKLSDEDGVFLYLEKKAGYRLCRKALDLSWEWIERKNVNEIEPWIFCDYLDNEDGIDLISYESDAIKAGDKESANIYGIMNCIILYIAYQAFEYAGKEYLPDYLWGIDDEFYAEGILDYTSKIKGCNFEDILDYCNRKTEKSSNIIFKKEEMMSIFLKSSCMGRGWSFNYGSRIYRDTGDTEHTRIHLEAVTGHFLCFEKQDGAWVNQGRGTAQFRLEAREGAAEGETFLLTDVMEHTLCAYDRQGQLCRVEYPNGQKLRLTYNENGLERITTPVGNVLEVRCGGGHILQVTDEIGRRTQYRYDGDYMTDVVHTDEGITHYEYDGNGHITAVTDQNGSRYMENEYDERGRITRQCFPEGICQTFTYDDLHRRNTVYYSETGKTETYEY